MTITVIGEFCEDIFVYGDCKKLSPEAPVPVFTPVKITTNSGMAGNVVENAKVLSSNTEIIGIHQNKKITKTRYVDYKSNHMFIRIDEGEEDVDKFVLDNENTNLIINSDIVIVSDYNKGFLNHDDIAKIGYLSRLSILDSKKILNRDIVNSYSFIKMNESEFKQNVEVRNKNNVITTLGSKGCMFEGEIFESPSPKETIDVSGAGDTFTTSFILKYFETKNKKESIIFANKMASIVVSKRGVTTP